MPSGTFRGFPFRLLLKIKAIKKGVPLVQHSFLYFRKSKCDSLTCFAGFFGGENHQVTFESFVDTAQDL